MLGSYRLSILTIVVSRWYISMGLVKFCGYRESLSDMHEIRTHECVESQ